MNPLENPVPIYAAGAVLATLAAIAFLARRNLPSVAALIVVLILTAAGAVTERLVVTESEEVESAVEEIVAAVEANDTAGVVGLLDPNSGLAPGVEALMSQVKVTDAGATSIRVNVTGQQAESRFRGRLDGSHTRSGQRVFFFDEVLLVWSKASGEWRLIDYDIYQDGKPLDLSRWRRGN